MRKHYILQGFLSRVCVWLMGQCQDPQLDLKIRARNTVYIPLRTAPKPAHRSQILRFVAFRLRSGQSGPRFETPLHFRFFGSPILSRCWASVFVLFPWAAIVDRFSSHFDVLNNFVHNFAQFSWLFHNVAHKFAQCCAQCCASLLNFTNNSAPLGLVEHLASTSMRAAAPHHPQT